MQTLSPIIQPFLKSQISISTLKLSSFSFSVSFSFLFPKKPYKPSSTQFSSTKVVSYLTLSSKEGRKQASKQIYLPYPELENKMKPSFKLSSDQLISSHSFISSLLSFIGSNNRKVKPYGKSQFHYSSAFRLS